VNLGNPGEYSMLELAETVIELTGSTSGLQFSPAPMDDPKRRQPNIVLAGDKLGWAPEVGLKQGLERTIDYFRELVSER